MMRLMITASPVVIWRDEARRLSDECLGHLFHIQVRGFLSG